MPPPCWQGHAALTLTVTATAAPQSQERMVLYTSIQGTYGPADLCAAAKMESPTPPTLTVAATAALSDCWLVWPASRAKGMGGSMKLWSVSPARLQQTSM
jgi:hypothetical protein